MGSDGVVFLLPGCGELPCFVDGVEVVHFEEFVSESCVEGFDVSVLPGRARGDVERLHSEGLEPFRDFFGDEFTAVVRENVPGRSPFAHEVAEYVNHVSCPKRTAHVEGETLARVLWPANHKMIDVVVSAGATDLCDPVPVVTLVSVINSESDNSTGGGDGSTNNDIRNADIGTADFDISLRAERSGKGDGRVYTLTYRATDASGNWVEESVTVDVPHDGSAHSCDQPDCDLNNSAS